jgi:small subunit ribosomal protein S17
MSKNIVGIVSSVASDKTIVITTHTRKTHPLYKKQFSVTKKFMAHDEASKAEVGDTVQITECRPISKRKHFKLTKIIDKPKLREDSLAAVKSEDKGKVSTKAKNQTVDSAEAKS